MKYSLTLIGLLLPVFLFAQITEKDGKVGIGVPEPTTKLDVNGAVLARGGLTSSVSHKDIGGYISIENPAKTGPGAAWRWLIMNMAGSTYGNSLQFWAYDSIGCGGGLCRPQMVILDKGYVGIGTMAPNAELTVAGTIISKRVKVTQNGWADYVFEPDYKLPTLTEVQQHISIHKHLPDIPSATAIEQDGLDLGEMQRRQMQKIEELTLYIIQQQKEIEALKAAVKSLSDKEQSH